MAFLVSSDIGLEQFVQNFSVISDWNAEDQSAKSAYFLNTESGTKRRWSTARQGNLCPRSQVLSGGILSFCGGGS